MEKKRQEKKDMVSKQVEIEVLVTDSSWVGLGQENQQAAAFKAKKVWTSMVFEEKEED